MKYLRRLREARPAKHAPQVARGEKVWVKLKDAANMGYYVLSPEAFAPDSNTAPARVTIVKKDLKNPTTLSKTDIEGEASAPGCVAMPLTQVARLIDRKVIPSR